MKQKKQNLLKKTGYWIGVIVVGFGLGTSVQLVHGWINPSSPPPGGNLTAPITPSSTSQYKIGSLMVGAAVQPNEKLEVGNGNIKLRNTGSTGRGQIIFESSDPGYFGSTPVGYNTINTTSNKGYIGIYGGPDWIDGGAIEVTGKEYDQGPSGGDKGVVAITFVGGTDDQHGGFYLVDSTDLSTLPFRVRKQNNSGNHIWKTEMDKNDLYVNQNAYISTIYYTSAHRWSDEKLKTNVVEIDDALNKINQLRGVTFQWKKDGQNSMGFLAQEMEKVFPDLVSLSDEDNPNSYKTVDYEGLTAPLVEAVKELKNRNDANKQKIDDLENTVNELKAEIEQLKNK